ncbi:MAG: hypothetical protein QGG22_03845 [Candidatus Thalassarchaeaceae archaeon]|jgi:hypothetical protein|nr:hypothetical protein [Candidatus Thalassarchaeaceae archaeon]|tara:strand:- start:5310 stop:6503 length:1194 start_codon:yes stop_codon:yes gene_type:complete
MAIDVVPESKTLHIKKLRFRWQVLLLQTLSTVSLLFLMRKMSELYGECSDKFVANSGSDGWCPAYEHTRGLRWMESNGNTILPNFITGINESGFDAFTMPLILCVVLTALWVFVQTRGERTQLIIKRTLSIILASWFLLPFLISWLIGMVSYGPYLPIGNADEQYNHIELVLVPFEFFFELIFFGIVFAPILIGLMGIWGLSKRMITWATGYFLMVIGIHAMLTFEGVTTAVDVGLRPLSAQIGEATLFGGLISPLAFDLLTVAILLLVFLESGLAVITNLEYTSVLPEASKNDPEYVNQFNNIINGHLIHLFGIMIVVSLTTALALEFDDFLISFVGFLEGSQWSGQVKESLELQLTYGKVISASLFMIVVAGGRFVIPWQRLTGVIETGLSKIRN